MKRFPYARSLALTLTGITTVMFLFTIKAQAQSPERMHVTSGGDVRALAEDAEYVWVGTYGGGIGRFSGSEWTVNNTGNSGLPNDHVYAIAIDFQGNIWIGTEGGLEVYPAR